MTTSEPWWAKDAAMVEILRRTAEEFNLYGAGPDLEPVIAAGPDPVLVNLVSGQCRRELGEARDGLVDARDRYDAAALKARTAGFSWSEIGRVLGVSKQRLHRRYGTRRT